MRLVFFLIFYFILSFYAKSEDVTFTSTNLPLVVIDTKGQDIVNEPKINASMKIIYNGSPNLNYKTDPGNIYDGDIGIEYRGAFSQSLPQKPFGFETRDNLGNKLNVSLLGMPEEHDWILLANYNDRTFIRNTLAFHLFEEMGHYAPRSSLCEVIVNDSYEGIYVLTEKIKQDKNRVDISKLDSDDNTGDSLTGGYIFKVDYYNVGYDCWKSNYPAYDRPDDDVYFVYDYPKVDNITDQQKNYLMSFVDSYETALYGNNFTEELTGYRNYISVKSFIDYFIIGEVSRNADAYKKSCFYFKDKDSKGGQLHAGPVWDFDWAWKNLNDNCYIFGNTDGSGWAYMANNCNKWPVPPAWQVRLLEDSNFTDRLYTRYADLRKTFLSNDYLNNYIDSIATLVEEAQERHFQRWPFEDTYFGASEVDGQPDSYAEAIARFTNWVSDRVNWLDHNMPGTYIETSTTDVLADKKICRLFPNPAKNLIYFESDYSFSTIEIYNNTGLSVKTVQSNRSYSTGINIRDLTPGLYIAKVLYDNNTLTSVRFIKE
jgi:spore coat protein CotH